VRGGNEWPRESERENHGPFHQRLSGGRGASETERDAPRVRACASRAERKRTRTRTWSKRDGRSERKGKKIKKEKSAANVCCVRSVCVCCVKIGDRVGCRRSGGAAAAAAALIPPFPPPNVYPTTRPSRLSMLRSPYRFTTRRLLISCYWGAGGNL